MIQSNLPRAVEYLHSIGQGWRPGDDLNSRELGKRALKNQNHSALRLSADDDEAEGESGDEGGAEGDGEDRSSL